MSTDHIEGEHNAEVVPLRARDAGTDVRTSEATIWCNASVLRLSHAPRKTNSPTPEDRRPPARRAMMRALTAVPTSVRTSR